MTPRSTWNGETCTKCGTRPRKHCQSWCKECHAAYMRAWREKRRAQADPWQSLLAKHGASGS